MRLQVAVSWFPRATGTDGPVELETPPERVVTAADLLARLDVPPDTALVVRHGVPIPIDTQLADGDQVRIVRTISGG